MRSLPWFVAAVMVVVGCGGGDTGGSTDDVGSSAGDAGSSGSGGFDATCETDPLKTGIIAEQTGVSADVADCSILKWAAQYGEPDPMIVKAMIYGESRFDYAAAGCPNLPCGVPDGWIEAEGLS